MISHSQFLDKYLRTSQDYDWGYGIQCTDLCKLYSKEVYGIELWTFWWTARSGWYNKSKTFDLKIWDKIVYKPWINPPKQGDIIFYDTWISWHVSVCHSATKIDIIVIEANWGTWDWKWKGYDQINLETKRDFNWILGWYTLKKLW